MTTYAGTTQGFNQFMTADAQKQVNAHSVLTRMGKLIPLPANNTVNWQTRRPQNIAASVTPLSEGITPSALSFAYDIITSTVKQYGGYLNLTDVLIDASTYNSQKKEMAERLGQQAIASIEKVAYYNLRAGTSVFRANGSARTDINTPVSLNLIRQAVQYLMNNQAMTTKGKIAAGSGEGTYPIPKAYIAVAHPYLRNDIQNLPGFIPVQKYPGGTDDMIMGGGEEIGTIDSVRVIISNAFDAFADGGGAKAGSGVTMLSTSGTNADVYPILIFGDEAFAHCSIVGGSATGKDGKPTNNSIKILETAPGGQGDPLYQRSTIGWKAWHDTKILNDNWMTRLEVAATDLSA